MSALGQKQTYAPQQAMSAMRKFAFVAGATGAAATRLIEELLRQKWCVIGASRESTSG
jgi:hypothetical protein